MTSSLVGSEMCIRDRDEGDTLRRSARAAPGIPPPLPRLHKWMLFSAWSCLLYTSDACRRYA
eukprot:5865015-Prorocentrum_lima.AAC.1